MPPVLGPFSRATWLRSHRRTSARTASYQPTHLVFDAERKPRSGTSSPAPRTRTRLEARPYRYFSRDLGTSRVMVRCSSRSRVEHNDADRFGAQLSNGTKPSVKPFGAVTKQFGCLAAITAPLRSALLCRHRLQAKAHNGIRLHAAVSPLYQALCGFRCPRPAASRDRPRRPQTHRGCKPAITSEDCTNQARTAQDSSVAGHGPRQWLQGRLRAGLQLLGNPSMRCAMMLS